ncbi:HpsJ family protein [Floridanema aerugineum]|uniref:HpsJ family protein n=1 Tax=Floridaenema aerugineum BLCC-F46 TaxID=3153654 RepID=A0ABV4X4H6_9CYAN
MQDLSPYQWRSIALLRIVGYGILALAAIDYIIIFIPPNFTNPAWEFQMLSQLVEKSPVPLIGLALVFYAKDEFRKDFEEHILRVLSSTTLVVGIAYFLLVPLGFNNTLRLNTNNNAQINNLLSQQLSQLQQINDRLNQATSQQDINNLFTSLNRQGKTPDIKNPEELRNRLQTEIATAQTNAKTQSEINRRNLRIELIKNSVKWNLGAIICGVLFIYIWKITDWAR